MLVKPNRTINMQGRGARLQGHRRGDRRDDFVAVMKPLEAAPKGGIGPPIRSP
jgi:hypothetical protein